VKKEKASGFQPSCIGVRTWNGTMCTGVTEGGWGTGVPAVWGTGGEMEFTCAAGSTETQKEFQVRTKNRSRSGGVQ